MKKLFSLFVAAFMALSVSAVTVYSWDGSLNASNETANETGGVATAMGGNQNTVVGKASKTNWCLNLGKGYSNGENYIKITLNAPLQGGETITTGCFVTGNSKPTADLVYGINFGGENELTLTYDADNAEASQIPYISTNAAPEDATLTVPAAAAGKTEIWIYRKSGSTTLLVSKFVVSREGPDPEYVVEGSIAGTLTPATPASLATGLGANNRGGFALKEDGLYFCNNATGRMSKMALDLSSIAAVTDSTAKGHYMQEDEAGNVVVWAWTVGSATLDVAQVLDANFQAVRYDSLAIDGRTDMPSVAGNVLQGRGAYFACGANKNTVLRFNLMDGVMTTVDTITLPFTANGINYVSALDVDHFYVQGRGNGVAVVDMSGATPVVTNMPFFQQVALFTSTHGGVAFKFAGHILYAMGTYKVEGYLGSFAIFDVTDPANVYQIAEDRTKAGTSGLGTSCATFRVAVDGETATIYEYAAQVVRKYTLTVSPACYLKQGNEGAEWVSMTAGENGFTYEAVLAADSLYINGTAADAGATKFKLTDTNVTVNGTVVVKDTVRFTYNNGALTIDSLGHFVPTVVFNVTVPENTPGCYIAGTLNSWGFTRMSQLDATHYTYTWRAEGADAATVAYKYCAGASWDYVEKDAAGQEISNRAWAEADTVRTWLAVPTVNTITYELNGGVFNEQGWTSKGAICMDLQNDFNAAYSTTKAWVKWEDGVYYYKCGENWIAEDQAAGQASTVAGFIQNVTYNTTNQLKTLVETTQADKYAWLVDVIKANRAAQGLGVDEASMVENLYRKEISGFFLASPAEGSWPASSSFETTAGADFYAPIWKHALANPETVSATFILNAPYKEGYTFDGWYENDDFSGEKVVSIDENTPSCTLYAKWVEYIMTVKEVVEADSAANVRFAGVVTFVNGKNVYLQDATGGMLAYFNANATCNVGDRVVITGVRTNYAGAPEVKNAEITSTETATLPTASKVALSQLMAAPLTYFATRVYVEGLTVTSLDSNKNPFVTDGIDTVQCYKMVVDDKVITPGAKVNITAIAGYYNKFQFVGDAAGIVLAPKAGVDPYNYPARGENGEYTLTNEWLYSDKLDNFSANKPATNDYARGMAAKDGIMYFVNRETASLTRVDGATGEMLDPLPIIGEHMFEKATVDETTQETKWSAAVTLAYNDIKFDNAGHALISGCMTTGTQHFMVYSVDLTTGAATKLIDEVIYDNHKTKTDSTTRFDAFGVYGDVTGHAIIMAMDAMSYNAWRWEINNGIAGPAIKVPLNINSTDNTYLHDEKGELVSWNSGAPQCFPVDEDYFYIDAHACLPTLFQYELDEDQGGAVANFIEDFKSCAAGIILANNEGDTCQMNQGHNGLCEFELNGEYFIVMAATNTAGTPTSSFALYKFANAAKSFAGLTPMWYFPAAGMGAVTNGCRTAVPSVEVDEEAGEATLYVYTNNNGYGVYTFTSAPSTAIESVEAAQTSALKVLENGQIYIIKNGVKYSILGASVK